MSKTQSQLSLFDRLALIDKEVIRVLGKQKDNIITITSIDVFHSYVSSCINTGVIAIDTETNNSLDPLTCKLMGLCLYAPGIKAAYIPINHRDPITKTKLINQVSEEDVKTELQRVAEFDFLPCLIHKKFHLQNR